MVEAVKTFVKKALWVMKIPYLPEAIRAVVRGPYTVRFPFGETVDTGAFRGKPVWDEDVCIGCSACAEVCPAAAIEMTDDVDSDPPMRRFKLHYDRCIFCGHCHYNCTTDDGIYQTPDWDTATYDRAEACTTLDKELLLCEYCGGVVGPKDQIRWVARKVGPKAYANPSLVLTLEGALVSAPQTSGSAQAGMDRSHIMRVLCPHCRRAVVLGDRGNVTRPGGQRKADSSESPPPCREGPQSAWERGLLDCLRRRVVLVGVGNRDAGDDGFGPRLAAQLSRRGVPRCLDCGTTPENFLGRIVALAPTDVIFADAVDFARQPGADGGLPVGGSRGPLLVAGGAAREARRRSRPVGSRAGGPAADCRE